MLKCFIDCGSFSGGTIGRFRLDYPGADEFVIHAFDPDPRMKWTSSGIAHHEAAVWIDDGETDFYLGDPESSSLFRDKTTGNIRRDDPVKVKTVDFSRWLRETVGPDDYCVLKLNIEGAEYPVLTRMMDEGTIRLVDELFIEWHWDRIGLPQMEHDAVVRRLRDEFGIIGRWMTAKTMEGYSA